jgi:hypothetical protein
MKHSHQKPKQNKTQKAIQHRDANRVESRARTSIGGMIQSTNIIKADYVDHEMKMEKTNESTLLWVI